MIRLVILGAPGSGKGTHTYKIAKKYNLKHVVVGDAVKAEIRNKTELGKIMYEYTSVGKFVPTEIVIDVLKKQVEDLKGFDGYIIDTAPINMEQKAAMKDFIIDGVIWLKVENFDILKERILNRLICPNCRRVTTKSKYPNKICPCCGSNLEERYDDNEETFQKRISQYIEKTLPVVKEYEAEGKVIEIDAEQEKKDVYAEICDKLDKFLKNENLVV